MSRPGRIVLVMGATGKQGGATVSELCKLPNSKQELRILAVTRSPDSESAQQLRRRHPQVELFRGDYDDIGRLFDSLPGTPDALFSVQPNMYSGYTPEIEERQGTKLHEAAIDVGVKHIVYTSVDRHGADSDTTATHVPHFDSKWKIEQHLTAECARAGSGTTWTILRPATFFDNLTPDMAGRVVAATIGKCPRPQQMVACRDIGWFAARALTGHQDNNAATSTTPSGPLKALNAMTGGGASGSGSGGGGGGDGKLEEVEVNEEDGPVAIRGAPANPWAFRKISLAGDELGLPALRERFYEKMGYPLPEAYGWMAGGALWYMKDLGAMYRWLDAVGYGADIGQCRREHPGMMRFADWLQKESGFTQGSAVLGSWLS